MNKTLKFRKLSEAVPAIDSRVLLIYIPSRLSGNVKTTIAAKYTGDGKFDNLYTREAVDGDVLAWSYIDPSPTYGRLQALRLRYWYALTDWQRMTFDILSGAILIQGFISGLLGLYALTWFVFLFYQTSIKRQ